MFRIGRKCVKMAYDHTVHDIYEVHSCLIKLTGILGIFCWLILVVEPNVSSWFSCHLLGILCVHGADILSHV